VREEGFPARAAARIFKVRYERGTPFAGVPDWRLSPMKIACVLGQGFEDSEFRIPYDRLKEAGYQVDVIGLKAGEELKGYRGKEKVKAEKSIDQVKAADYDALLIPGGQSPDHLRVDKRMVDFVKQFDDQAGKLIAAVCHGPQLMMAAHLVKGRTLTAWQTIQDDLQQMGANVKDQPVVKDRNWITSRKPEDLEQFSSAIIEELERGDAGLRDTGRPSQPDAHA
jgi:protease I